MHPWGAWYTKVTGEMARGSDKGEMKVKFLDKTRDFFIPIILGIMIALLIIEASSSKGNILVSYFLCAAVILSIFLSCHLLPLRIKEDKIFLASAKFPSFGRKAVPLKDIRKIQITNYQYWDESTEGMGFKFIRVEDIYGNQYRNIVYSLNGFKKSIEVAYPRRQNQSGNTNNAPQGCRTVGYED